MKARSAKNKGRKFQNEVAAKVSELIDIKWGQDELIASRTMGLNGVDIILIGEAKKRFPWSVECKNDKSFNLKSWIRQAEENRLKGTDWLVLFKKNYFRPCACLDLEVFTELFLPLGPFECGHKCETTRWYVDKWIKTTREKSNVFWYINLNDLYAIFEMGLFFHLLKEDPSYIKGRVILDE